MSERVRFYFDPLCPWAFQTSRWMRRLEGLGEVEVEWRVFSLPLVNRREGEEVAADRSSSPALRTAELIRERVGQRAVGDFYQSLGWLIHAEQRTPDDPRTIAEALRRGGVDASLGAEALADDSTWQAVCHEFEQAVASHRVFGVPAIALAAGAGPAMFGPILADLPPDTEARELWGHVRWLISNQSFAELKRERSRRPAFTGQGATDSAAA